MAQKMFTQENSTTWTANVEGKNFKVERTDKNEFIVRYEGLGLVMLSIETRVVITHDAGRIFGNVTFPVMITWANPGYTMSLDEIGYFHRHLALAERVARAMQEEILDDAAYTAR